MYRISLIIIISIISKSLSSILIGQQTAEQTQLKLNFHSRRCLRLFFIEQRAVVTVLALLLTRTSIYYTTCTTATVLVVFVKYISYRNYVRSLGAWLRFHCMYTPCSV